MPSGGGVGLSSRPVRGAKSDPALDRSIGCGNCICGGRNNKKGNGYYNHSSNFNSLGNISQFYPSMMAMATPWSNLHGGGGSQPAFVQNGERSTVI